MKEEKRGKQCKFTIDEEQQIIKEYQEGTGSTSLAKKYNTSANTICKILQAYNIKRRTYKEARNTHIKININSFKKEFESPEMAYWLGVMYSDGYLSCTRMYTNSFGIAVQESDKEWLEQFKNYLGYNGKIRIYTQVHGYNIGGQYARLIVGNNEIVQDLKKWGVQEHKSLKPVHFPDTKYPLHFIYGYIDGNGSIHKKNGTLFISGQKAILQDIADYLQLPYHIYDDKTIGNLVFTVLGSKEIYKKILSLNSKYYLKRKRELILLNQ